MTYHLSTSSSKIVATEAAPCCTILRHLFLPSHVPYMFVCPGQLLSHIFHPLEIYITRYTLARFHSVNQVLLFPRVDASIFRLLLLVIYGSCRRNIIIFFLFPPGAEYCGKQPQGGRMYELWLPSILPRHLLRHTGRLTFSLVIRDDTTVVAVLLIKLRSWELHSAKYNLPFCI